MINWKVRFKNKMFWLAFIPVALILIERVAAVFGVVLDFTELGGRLTDTVEAVFLMLGVLGIVTDPTTEGLADSARAMTYDKPKGD